MGTALTVKSLALRVSIWALAMFLAMPLAVNAQASSVPALPHYFYGTLKIDGADAPAGTTVEARVTGALKDPSFNPITTTQTGKYGSADASAGVPRLLVQGDIAEGSIIQFFVNNRQADQTAAFHSSQITALNLTVNTPAPSPLAVNTELFSGIGTTTATLNGRLSQTGGAESVSLSFQWGMTQIYEFETPGLLLSEPGAFSSTLTSLSPDTVYHFRAKAVAGQTTTYGADMAFRTDAPLITNISLTTDTASNITATAAVLNGSLTQLSGVTSVTASFQWGTTVSYGSETAGQTLNAPGAFSATLSGLTPNTPYHFRAKAVAGQTTAFGTDLIFTTGAVTLGGTGGGGGGGGSTPPATGSSVSLNGLTGDTLSISSSGVIAASTRLNTPDGKATINIPIGTTMLTATGSPITGLSAAPASPPPPPSQGTVLSNYDFGPSGATFNPPLVINLTYADKDIPDGVNETDLAAALWDGSQWVKLASFVDTGKNTISALVPHFTNIAVVYAPSLAPGVSPEPTPAQTPSSAIVPTSTPSPAQTPPSEIIPAPTLPPSLPAVASTPPPIPSPAAPGVPPTINWGLGLIAGVLAVFIVIMVTTLFRRLHRA